MHPGWSFPVGRFGRDSRICSSTIRAFHYAHSGSAPSKFSTLLLNTGSSHKAVTTGNSPPRRPGRDLSTQIRRVTVSLARPLRLRAPDGCWHTKADALFLAKKSSKAGCMGGRGSEGMSGPCYTQEEGGRGLGTREAPGGARGARRAQLGATGALSAAEPHKTIPKLSHVNINTLGSLSPLSRNQGRPIGRRGSLGGSPTACSTSLAAAGPGAVQRAW